MAMESNDIRDAIRSPSAHSVVTVHLIDEAASRRSPPATRSSRSSPGGWAREASGDSAIVAALKAAEGAL
jgi:hypothetical protein